MAAMRGAGRGALVSAARAPFGVRGNRIPAALSWILTVGWETVLCSLATMATATVFGRLGWGGGTGTEIVALVVVATLTRGIPLPLGVIGHEGSTVIVVLNGLRLLRTRDATLNESARNLKTFSKQAAGSGQQSAGSR